MTAYREPGRDVDVTAIEQTKIHETEETRRASITARETTRREALKARDTMGYMLSRLFYGIVALAAIIAAGVTADSYLTSKQVSTGCRDESFRKNANNNPRCPATEQRMSETPEFWICTCPRHEAKPVGSQ